MWHRKNPISRLNPMQLLQGLTMKTAWRSGVLNAFKLPLHKVKVRKIAIGGAFGGRSEICPVDYICALLAKKTKKPVRIQFTREENTIATRQGHAMITTHKTGVDKDGRVLARETTCYMDGGAYSSTGPIATSVPFLSMEQAYRMESVRYNGYRIYTNKPIRGMIRTHGRGFACGLDTQLDMIADHLGIDPVEIRLRNSRQPGEYTSTGSYVDSCAMDETIHKAVEKSGFKKKRYWHQFRADRVSHGNPRWFPEFYQVQ